MNRQEAFRILGVPSSATEEEIKKAYRAAASKHHPDKGGDEVKFKELQEAARVLATAESEPPPGFRHGFGPGFGTVSQAELDEMLKQFHSTAFGQGRKQLFQSVINVTFDEAFNGVVKQVDIGMGVPVQTVTIPQGVGEGEIIKTIDGDSRIIRVYASITGPYKIDWGQNNPHDRGNLTQDVYISPFIMIMGGFIEVKMIDGGVVQVRIPAGLEANKLLKVAERGYWKNSGGSRARGHLFLRAIPEIKKLEELKVADVTAFIKAVNEREPSASA